MERLAAWLLRSLHLGRGRPAAIAVLLAVTAALYLPAEAPLKRLRLALFDGYQAYLPRELHQERVRIVGIDQSSLETIGQWPWPRNRLAALIDRIAAYRPLAIGLDIIMPEHDAASPEALA